MRTLIGRTMTGLGGLAMLSACGGGGTTGTNYSDAPPVATIVATPSPRPSETPAPESAKPPSESGAAGNAL